MSADPLSGTSRTTPIQSPQPPQRTASLTSPSTYHPSPTLPNISPLAPRPPLPGQVTDYNRPRAPLSPGDGWAPNPLPPAHGDGGSPQFANAPPRSTSNGGLTPRSAQYTSPTRESRRGVDEEGGKKGESARGPPVDGFVRIKVMALEKNRRDIYVKFNAESNLPAFRQSSYRGVSRSYAEFQRFAEAIGASQPQSIIPALPLAQTSAATDEEDDRLVKAAFQRWVARLTADPGVMGDEELRSFIESDFGYTPNSKLRRRVPPTFFFPRGPRLPDEQDDDLTLAKSSMTRLEATFLDASKAVERVSKSRRNVAVATSEVADHLVTFASTETYTPLANGIKKLAKSTKVAAELAAALATSELVMLGDTLVYQASNARSAKDTLVSRDVILQEHRAAAKATISKKRNIERLKGSSKIQADRVDEALEELDDAESHQLLLAKRLANISQHLQPSLRTHSQHAHEDILSALLNHARTSLLYEKQLLKELEVLRPAVHAIKKPEPGVYYHTQPSHLTSPTLSTSSNRSLPATVRRNSMGNGPLASSLAPAVTANKYTNGSGSKSMIVGPGAPNFSVPSVGVGGSGIREKKEVEKRSIQSMARSVVVADDRRQKVDAKMAASMLANGF